jgi:hypothetical protein
MKSTHFFAFLSLIFLFANCKQASRARQIQPDILRSTKSAQLSSRGIGDSVLFHYIGCGGFLIRKGDESVLIDPYFSNANITKNPFQSLKTDTALIDHFFMQNFKNTEGSIQTVLIAHAHHDHLADLPSIIKRNLQAEKITIIGSQTTRNILQAFKLPFDVNRQMISFDTLFDKKDSSTRYISPNKRIQITAIKTEHAPHFLGMKLPFIGGNVDKVPQSPPQTSLDFKEGVNYNFMIDFLNADGTIDFRIFSSAGAAANAPIGFPTPSVLNEKKVDILLLCGANYDQVKGYPEKIVGFIKPEKIFVAHWEDFFRPIPLLLKKPRVVPLTNIPKFLTILKKTMSENGIEPTPIIVQPLTQVFIKY